jgi:FkbM family methyltransferase
MNEIGLRFERLLEEQIGLLDHTAISRCASRRGLRERSGSLLEAAFLDLAVRLTPTLSIEIGAHEGSFSERLKASVPTVYALAFEANPFVYRRHAERLRQLASFVDYKHAAISDEDGTAELYIPVTRDGVAIDSGRLSSLSRRMSTEFEYERVLVPALMLDTALQFLAVDRSVAWIDAEGIQGRILAGGDRYFSHVLALYIEIERKQVWQNQMLDSEVARRLADFSLVPIMRDNLALGQYNEVYIRTGDDIADAALASVQSYIDELRVLLGAAASNSKPG